MTDGHNSSVPELRNPRKKGDKGKTNFDHQESSTDPKNKKFRRGDSTFMEEIASDEMMESSINDSNTGGSSTGNSLTKKKKKKSRKKAAGEGGDDEEDKEEDDEIPAFINLDYKLALI